MRDVQDESAPIVRAAHRYEHCRRDDLLKYEIFDYLPGHSTVYKQWIERTPRQFNWDRWVLTALIGVLIGITGLFMQQIIMSVAHFKWSYTEHFIQVFLLSSISVHTCLYICRCISLYSKKGEQITSFVYTTKRLSCRTSFM